MSSLLQVRVTGVVVEEERILLVKQRVSADRAWSLPGGRVEQGETLEAAIVRELEEETGLSTEVVKLLYLCDKPDASPSLLHVTFLLRATGGEIRLPSNEFDANPIADVAMVPIEELEAYGFSAKFASLVRDGFPNAGSYQGLKSNIGL
ncbi:DNA mismatch repair protein MutT [Paenibacillus sp. CCS19]|uniref:NUDIX hydrolase n=1 Tax=Paenibacillus sp. CCS19 TaxID=3158387 RepID=UPI002563C308|nr:NUDIX hydrolase [Paenibacillus cellulosilyticus]GMK38566.1 DNA mismatch repair protein MutT [Paenibacillus cellulosilyticus]